jgi:succinyl-CoA synthetase beta subunit
MLEHQGKELLRRYGINCPKEYTAVTVDEAASVAGETGYPVVLKAQVLCGGRGKAGGIAAVNCEKELRATADRMLGMSVKNEICRCLLVAEAVDIAREYYAGVTIDAAAGRPVLILSAAGGVDIEHTTAATPEKLRTLHLSSLSMPRRHEILEELRLAEIKGDDLPKVCSMAQRMVEAFFACDCTTLEINPLVVTADGICLALDAKAVIDDEALARQGLQQTDSYPASDIEKRAAAIGVNYVRLDPSGDVAVIAGGAGLGMAGMDMVNNSGRKTGSFLDTGGGISKATMAEALRISLETPGIRGVFINIFGGINNCAEVARGIVEVVDADKPDAVLVVKMRGHSQDEGWALLDERKVPLIRHGTSEDAVRLLTACMDGVRHGHTAS